MHSRSRIALVLAVLLALALRSGAAFAIDNSSARIYSLGGDHVAGVIPDLYTDIGVNPAYAFFADRLNTSYARRFNPGYDPSLPYLMERSGSYSGPSLMVNELSAWGIRLSSWRTAVFAQWALDRPEHVYSYPYTGFDNGAYVELREEGSSDNSDFARIDLVAARPLDDRYTLGLRIEGQAYDYYHSYLTSNAYDRYDDLYFADIQSQRRDKEARSYSGRRYSLDVQAGIVQSDDTGPRTDFAITASLNRPDQRQEHYELDISKEYDQLNEIDGYRYYRYYWNDAREGNMWTIALMFRHSFDHGIRVLAGGDISTCSYETDWSGSDERLQWGSWSGPDRKVAGAFDGDGSLLDGSFYAKGSTVFNLHRTTDLYFGIHGVFARISAEEEPLVHYSIAADGPESAVQIDQALRLESIETSFALSIPLSVEFRPSSWFTYFSSFVLSGEWRKLSTRQPIPSLFTFRPPVRVSRVGGANLAGASSEVIVEPEAYSTEWDKDLYTSGTVTLGFSLHYRDTFFVDVYTQSEIIPTYLANNVFDIRYAF